MQQRSAFFRRHEAELRNLLARCRRELLDDVIPFWEKRVVDEVYGGYLNCFDRQGVLQSGCKPGWFAGRNLYMFSALYNTIEKNGRWLEIAQVGRRWMDTSFCAGGGRYNQMMSRDGKVINGFTSVFTDHFLAKGIYEYILAAGLQGDEQEVALARGITDQLLRDVADPVIQRMEGVPEGMQKHAINFMTLIVALESCKLFENVYREVLDVCVHRSLHVFANDEMQAPFEYVGAGGEPVLHGEGRLVDAGHTMESLWFSIHAGELCGRPEYYRRACTVMDWVLARTYDTEYGGFYQHVDVEHTVPQQPFLVSSYIDIPAAWNDKIWWVQAEGLYALAAAALYGENEHFFTFFLQMADYVEHAMRDPVYGEWYSVLRRDGSIRADRKGFELKGPYHVPRCLMQLVVLLQRYLDGTLPLYT
ncbi:MAG: hypothetical protein HDT26_01885 [Subdoligranulum sp.]|nr:hypothetical protein [Subdoligranulum sp.]